MSNKEQKILEYVERRLDAIRFLRQKARELDKQDVVESCTSTIQELYGIKEILEDNYYV
jgi:hypothetical protein